MQDTGRSSQPSECAPAPALGRTYVEIRTTRAICAENFLIALAPDEDFVRRSSILASMATTKRLEVCHLCLKRRVIRSLCAAISPKAHLRAPKFFRRHRES